MIINIILRINFLKVFFLTETKLYKVEILFFSQKSSFSFSSNFFIATFTFLDAGIVGITENV